MVKAKVLLCVMNSSFGGTEKHLVDLVSELDKTQFDVTLITPLDSKITSLLQEIQGIQVFPVRRGIISIYSMRKILRSIQPDIFHVHSPRATLLGLLAAISAGSKCERITTAHGWIANRLKFRSFYEILYVWSVKRYNKVFAVSHEVKNTLLVHKIHEGRIRVIHNGITYKKINEPRLRKKPVKFLFIGRWIEEKGLNYLISAAKKLYKKYPGQFIVDIYGEGPLNKWLENEVANQYFGVTLYSFLEPHKVIRKMEEYDCFLMPSVQEGFPYTLLEAFSAGNIVIASKIGGIPEAVINGHNGFLIQSKCEENLVEAMEKVIVLPNNELEAMKLHSQETAKLFSLESMIGNIEQEYVMVAESS
jgi:L-malate glycosyltransferase